MNLLDMPMGGGSLFMLVFWVIVVGLVLLLLSSLFGKGSSAPKPETDLDILKKRYARGEIDAEQFKDMKRFLTSQ